MSKGLRTLGQFQDALDGERIWRLRELNALRRRLLKPVIGGPGNEEDLAMLRPCIAMIYAHWEGFVKSACGSYLHFVALQRLPHKELSTPFLALAARRQAVENGLSGFAADRYMITRLRDAADDRGIVPYKSGVDTKSNLWFEVFQEVFNSLGLSADRYELRQKMIDNQLVAKRNSIAHGRYVDVRADDVDLLFDTVISIMDEIKEQLLDAASNKSYSA